MREGGMEGERGREEGETYKCYKVLCSSCFELQFCPYSLLPHNYTVLFTEVIKTSSPSPSPD